ncbi:MAG: class I adenylate-forming enzyme family protein [Hyphomicrobiales bacterium]
MERVRFGGLSDLTVDAVGRHAARTRSDRIALDDGEVRLTYVQMTGAVDAVATSLRDMGVRKGQVVSAYLPNCIEYVVTVLAVARAGAVFSPLNPRFKAGELKPILAQARPSVVFVGPERIAMLREALAAGCHDARIVCCGDDPLGTAVPWQDLLARRPEEPGSVSETDFFSLMFTSGTTGVPKGALATHKARMIWVLNACILYSLSETDAYAGVMPMVHSAGLTFTLMHLYVGGTVHILREFTPEAYLDLLERARITSSLVVPTMLVMTLEAQRRSSRSYDLSSLKRLVTCGSPLQLSTKQQVLTRITDRLYDYYGSTESNSMSVLKPEEQLRKPMSVGQPFPNVEIRIADENGALLPPGKCGEVWCRNPSLMTCYLDNPEATGAAISDGWFRTGDLGALDDEGFLTLAGRKGDMIISGGVNIYPAEIENLLMGHPAVLDCAVLGEPDPKWGQRVVAFVVPRAGQEIGLEALQQFCADTLADYKKPRRLEILDAIPKNAGGKTIKAELAKRLGQ